MSEKPRSQNDLIRVLAARSNLWVEVRPDLEWGGIEVGGGDARDNELCELMSLLTNVTALDVSPGTGIADDGFEILCAAFRDVRRLKFTSSHVREAGFRNIEQLRELRDVDVRVFFPGNLALRSLGQLPRLRKLRIVNSGVTGQGLRELQNCVELKVIDVSANSIEDGFDAFSGCHGLSDLIVEWCPISPNGIRELAELRTVRKLVVSRCPIRDEMMVSVGEMGGLHVLYANECPITARSMAILSGLRELKKLIWPAYAIDEAHLEVFQKHPALREVSFWGEPPVPKQTLQKLRAMLPNSTVENFYQVEE